MYRRGEMNEKALTVLGGYDLEIRNTYRTKGNYGCETTSGKYILQEYNNSNDKMEVMKKLYDYIGTNGILSDYVLANKEGSFVSISEDGYSYILKRWFNAEECNINNIKHVCLGAGQLGKFHKLCEDMTEIFDGDKGFHAGENMEKSFERHNKEIVKIKNYIKRRKNKNDFEMSLQKVIGGYYNQAQEASDELKQSEYEKIYETALEKKTLNYGSYNHHNIMFDGDNVILINMMKVNYAPQIQDLYDYLRKVMEKNCWDIEMAKKILDIYDSMKKVSEQEYKILKIMFKYPEKFWKIINYYYNSNKAWYSEKNEEKLKQFKNQEEQRWKFIDNL